MVAKKNQVKPEKVIEEFPMYVIPERKSRKPDIIKKLAAESHPKK